MSVKIQKQQLKILLDLIRYETSEAYLLFYHDKIEISFFNKDTISLINLNYESYICEDLIKI